MATTGATLAGTGANDAGAGSTAWSNAGNITADDSSYASVTVTFGAESQWLKATNFGFAVSGTVNGITATINRRITAGGVNDAEIRLVFAGSVDTLGGDRSAGAAWPGSFTTASFGGGADTWDNMTITASQVNNSGFGVAFRCVESVFESSTAEVNWIKIDVTYTPAGGGGPLTQSKLVGRSQLLRGLVR